MENVYFISLHHKNETVFGIKYRPNGKMHFMEKSNQFDAIYLFIYIYLIAYIHGYQIVVTEK